MISVKLTGYAGHTRFGMLLRARGIHPREFGLAHDNAMGWNIPAVESQISKSARPGAPGIEKQSGINLFKAFDEMQAESKNHQMIRQRWWIITATPMNESLAEKEFSVAFALLEQGHREEGLQALTAMLVKYEFLMKTAEGRPLYEAIQVQRAFSLMHLQRDLAAKPLLEEAAHFEIDSEVRSDVHCHLARCYHELGLYTLAREQFERANALGVSEERQPVFHYCYG